MIGKYVNVMCNCNPDNPKGDYRASGWCQSIGSMGRHGFWVALTEKECGGKIELVHLSPDNFLEIGKPVTEVAKKENPRSLNGYEYKLLRAIHLREVKIKYFNAALQLRVDLLEYEGMICKISESTYDLTDLGVRSLEPYLTSQTQQ